MPKILLIAAISYLLGSIPFGYLLVRIFRGEDVRQSGSGNIGATNVARMSPLLGVATLLLDALKGSAAVFIAVALSRGEIRSGSGSHLAWYPDHLWSSPMAARTVMARAGVAALFAVLGHLFPIWLKFRGGKGVATGLGSFALLVPKAVLAALGVFVLVVATFRYVSLGSIVAALLLPVFAWLLRDYAGAPFLLVCTAAASLLIVVKHRQNIRRLLAGTENRLGAKHS